MKPNHPGDLRRVEPVNDVECTFRCVCLRARPANNLAVSIGYSRIKSHIFKKKKKGMSLSSAKLAVNKKKRGKKVSPLFSAWSD